MISVQTQILQPQALVEDRERFLEAGMDDYLAKAVDKKELLAALDRNLSGTVVSEQSQ
ncbi:MAG: hypothetical protein R6U22_05950 [Desulfohalobiaceae bacterium]